MATTYDTYQRVLQVIGYLSEGYTRTQACDTASISVVTFENALRDDQELHDACRDATRRGHDAMADALLNIDNHKIYGSTDARMAGVVSKNIQWYLSKADASRFAERIEVKHNLTMDRAIVDALMRARDRTDTIDADFEVMKEPQRLEAPAAVVDLESDEEIMRQLMGG